MNLKSRIKRIEQGQRIDVSKLSDEELERLLDKYRAKCPNKSKAMSEVMQSLTDSELEYLKSGQDWRVSAETKARIQKVYQIPN